MTVTGLRADVKPYRILYLPYKQFWSFFFAIPPVFVGMSDGQGLQGSIAPIKRGSIVARRNPPVESVLGFGEMAPRICFV